MARARLGRADPVGPDARDLAAAAADDIDDRPRAARHGRQLAGAARDLAASSPPAPGTRGSTSSTPPRPTPCSTRSGRSTPSRTLGARLEQVRARRSSRCRSTPSSASGWRRRSSASPPARTSSRSPTPARRSRRWRATPGFRAVVHAPPDVGGRFSALTAVRARARAARRQPTPPRCSTPRSAMEALVQRPAASNPAAALAAFVVDALRRGPRQAHARHLGARCGRSACGSSSSWPSRPASTAPGIVPVLERKPSIPTGFGGDRAVVVLRFEDDDTLAGVGGHRTGRGLARARDRARRTPSRSAASSCAGSSRPRSSATCSASTRSTSRTSPRPRRRRPPILDGRQSAAGAGVRGRRRARSRTAAR